MKNLALKASALLLSLTALTACNSATDADQGATVVESTADAKPALNIRFIDADSVTAGYILAQEFQKKALSSVSRIESTTQSRRSELQKLGSSIEQKARNNGYLTQESYEADMQKYAKMESDAGQTIDRMQRQAQQELMAQQVELNDSLVSFIEAYNKEKGYDAILFKAAGIYFSPDLDITQEVIKGLNERYNASHK